MVEKNIEKRPHAECSTHDNQPNVETRNASVKHMLRDTSAKQITTTGYSRSSANEQTKKADNSEYHKQLRDKNAAKRTHHDVAELVAGQKTLQAPVHQPPTCVRACERACARVLRVRQEKGENEPCIWLSCDGFSVSCLINCNKLQSPTRYNKTKQLRNTNSEQQHR